MKINIIYRRKKSGLSMRTTKQGDINVSAPIGMPKADVMRFIEKYRDWIAQASSRKQEFEERRKRFYDQLPLDTTAQRATAVRRLDMAVSPLVSKYESLMAVKASGITYRRSKTNWGSCNPATRRINFSLYLLLLPDLCIEHVVVHELAHLIEPNHSPAFYAIMDTYFPRWKEARAEAKRLSLPSPIPD